MSKKKQQQNFESSINIHNSYSTQNHLFSMKAVFMKQIRVSDSVGEKFHLVW